MIGWNYLMKMYFAGVAGNIGRLKILLDNGFKNFMWSFDVPPSKNQYELLKKYNCTLMLDSGAFSVWKKGKNIDVYKYIEFIKKNEIKIYFNLDVIGDKEKTMINQKIMEENGLNPIPVFHYGEEFSYLDYLVESGYEYIGLGGTVGKSTKTRIEFFDKCFKKYPNIKFHGLGVTSKILVDMYNWYSVDSTTWLTPFKTGKEINMNGNQIISDEKDANKRFLNSLQYFNQFKL